MEGSRYNVNAAQRYRIPPRQPDAAFCSKHDYPILVSFEAFLIPLLLLVLRVRLHAF